MLLFCTMLQKSRAIILHSLKYGDSSLIVHAFTEEWGRQAFIMKGVRKSKKNNRANLFQPLYLLEMDVYFREQREMQWIKDVSLMGSAPSFNRDLVKATQAIFLSEVLMKVLREEEKNPALFSFLFHSIEYLDNLEKPSPSFHLLFLFQISSYLGFFPRKNFTEEKCYFDTVTGAFTSIPSSGNIENEERLGRHWKACFDLTYSTVDQHFINQNLRNLFLDSLLTFYTCHYESLGLFSSVEVLRTVFS